ncbi:MAG TPA: NB-ARC domain-containing protein [Ktedonobacterales bacterium]|nr:NB-ARC domain-containing protein [Ktedonobacterales bacterium]
MQSPESSTTAVATVAPDRSASAAATRTQSAPEAIYPRPRWAAALRELLRRWWLTTGVIVVTVAQTLVQTFLTSGVQGLSQSLDLTVIERSTFIGKLAAQHPVIFFTCAASLIALVPVGVLAERDYNREKRYLASVAARRQQEETIQELLRASQGAPVSPAYTAPLEIESLAHAATFVDRIEATRELVSLLAQVQSGATYGVEGMKGVGKTSFTYEVVRQAYARGAYPDGVAVVHCAGASDASDLLGTLITRVAGKGAVDDLHTPQDFRDAAFKALNGRKLLIVFDNVEPALSLRELLLPIKAAGCVSILTAAFRLPAGLCAHVTHLPLLTERDGVDVFAANLGRSYTPAEAQSMRSIVARVDCHTLAIVVIARYAAENERSLAALDTELADPDAVLALPADSGVSGEQGALNAAFSLSYRDLPEDARLLFRALGAMPTRTYTRADALDIAQRLGLASGRQALDLLIRRALLDQRSADGESVERITQHSLLYAFARELLDAALRARATDAIVEYYAAFCERHANDYARLNDDYDNIRGALQLAHEQMEREDAGASEPGATSGASLVARYLKVLAPFFSWYGHNQDALLYVPWGVTAAERRGDRVLLAEMSLAYGQAVRGLGRYDEAQVYYTRALDIAHDLQQPDLEIRALGRMADLAHARKQLDESLALRLQLAERARAAGDRATQAHTLVDVGHVLLDEDRLDEADGYLAQALEIAVELRLVATEGYALLMQGMSARKRGQWDDATALDIRAMSLFSSVGELGSVGGCLEELGQVAAARGDRADAVKHWNDAVVIYQRMGIQRAEYVRDQLIARLGATESSQ